MSRRRKGEPGPRYFVEELGAQGSHFGIVASRFNETITDSLLHGAIDFLVEHGVEPDKIHVARVPGAFEIPLTAKKMALSGRYSAVLCLGAVIRGETPHFEYISAEVSRGIASTALETGIPILFGVLMTDTVPQALERSAKVAAPSRDRKAEQEMNRGRQTAQAALQMANLMKQLQSI